MLILDGFCWPKFGDAFRRHSYATQLKANGEGVKGVQQSLRHANSRITLDTSTQALTSAKRGTQTKVVNMILPKQTRTAAGGRRPKTVQGILRHGKIQTTLDPYTQEDSDETRAAQGEFLNAVGMSTAVN